MRTLRILLAKELNAILASPIGYTVAGVFLLNRPSTADRIAARAPREIGNSQCS